MNDDRMKKVLIDALNASVDAKQKLVSGCGAEICDAATILIDTLINGHKILACGNGGSAADAQHFVAEIVGRFGSERRGLPAIALTTNTSNLTSIGNDYGFDQIFRRQVEALASEGDALLAISTSGNSPNVIAANEQARASGCKVVGLAGRDGGELRDACDKCVVVPSPDTPRIQEAHIFVIHFWCEMIDSAWEENQPPRK